MALFNVFPVPLRFWITEAHQNALQTALIAATHTVMQPNHIASQI